MKKCSFLFFAMLAFFSASVFAQSSVAQVGLLDGILQTYQSATANWINIAQGYALRIFVSLAGLSIAFFGVKIVFDGGGLDTLIGKIAMKFFWEGFFFTIIYMAPTWIPLISATFIKMGQGFATSGGGGAINSPSQIMDLGTQTANSMFGIWKTIASGSVTSIGNDIVLGAVLVVAAICAVVAFGLIAFQLLITQIELSILASIGMIMLGFLGSPATKSFGEKYFSYLISLGTKLMVIFAMASLGPSIAQTASDKIASLAAIGAVPLGDVLAVGIGLLIYGTLCSQIPAMASGMLSGSVATSAGAVAGAAMAGAAAGVGAAMAATGAVAAATKAGSSAASGLRSGLDHLSKLLGGGGDAAASGGSTLMNSLGGSSGSSSFGDDPFKGSNNESTFSKGMNKLGEGAQKLAASEGQAGGSGDVNTGDHGH